MIECDGSCEKHEEDVITVNIVDKETGRDWGEFNYCSVAVTEDERRGFILTPKEATNGK